jgi:Tfp pilus assembly protein PilN
MATTLMPVDPATSPQRAWRILTISAHLLPEEISAARRARRTRAWVLVALVVVVVLLAGWFLYAAKAKIDADNELADYAGEAARLQSSQNKDFSDVVEAQNQSAALDKNLKTLMANDLPWATLLDTLNNAAASSGVEVSGVTGALTSAGSNGAATAANTGTVTLPSSSKAITIGTLTLTGVAPDKPSVAKFVDTLSKLTTVANPYLTSAAQGDTGVQYSLQLDITGAALCGAYSTACKGGK